MPKRRYERREPTHEWSQIRPHLKDAAQIQYELIRPVVLFGVSANEMESNSFDEPDPLDFFRYEFAQAQAFDPSVVLTYEHKRERGGKEMLDVGVHHDRAWLSYYETDEDDNFDDVAFHSYDPSYQGEADAVYAYFLDNGQRDEYPRSWTLPAEDARRAVEYFLEEGKMAPWVHWRQER